MKGLFSYALAFLFIFIALQLTGHSFGESGIDPNEKNYKSGN